MKKFLFITSFIFFSYGLLAQSSLLVKAGMAYSNTLSPDDLFNQTEFKVGVQFGFLYTYHFENNWNLRSELLFTDKGYKISNTQDEEIRYRFFYLNMPLLAGYQYKKFNFEIGTELGYLLTAFYQMGNQNNEIEDFFNKFEIGATAGVSYSITEQLILNFRFSRGITPLLEVTATDTGSGVIRKERLYNHAIQLSVAFRIF